MTTSEQVRRADELPAITKFADVFRQIFKIAPLEKFLSNAMNRPANPRWFGRFAPNYYQYTERAFRYAIRHGLKWELDLREFHDWRVYFSAPVPARERLLKLIRPGDVVMDVGANIGEYALVFAQKIGPSGRVVCFEPFHPNLARLRRNVEINPLMPVTIVPKALSDATTKLAMRTADGLNFGTAHVCAKNETAGDSIESVRLDDLNLGIAPEKIRLLKIDVEGWEMHVLRGGEKFIRAAKPVIAIELFDPHLRRQGSSAREILEWLRRNGYRMEGVLDGKTITPENDADGCQLDVLAIPA